jgi:ABC-2 type transport system permease protein
VSGTEGANHPVVLVTRREVVERLRARSFLISTIIYMLIALASVIVPHLVEDDEPSYGVGLVGPQSFALEQTLGTLAPTFDLRVRTQRLADQAAGAAALRAESLDAVVIDGARVLARGDVPESLSPVLNAAVHQVRLTERLQAAGLSATDIARTVIPEPLAEERLTESRPVRDSNRPLAFAGVMTIYLLLLTYGFTVANGVLEEKSSRVSEVLLGALRPTQLLGGKVAGIGIVAVVQLLLIGIPTAVVALLLGSFSIPAGTPSTLAAVFLWAILGYGLYSCIFAAAGAAASRPEDVGNATAPITILIAGTYFAAVAAISSPDATLSRVLSFVPFMAPMTMLPRAAVGHVAAWEVPLAVAIVVLTTAATVRLGARVYAGGIRRPGPRLKLREAWRAASG